MCSNVMTAYSDQRLIMWSAGGKRCCTART